jgi:hypothetical protein
MVLIVLLKLLLRCCSAEVFERGLEFILWQLITSKYKTHVANTKGCDLLAVPQNQNGPNALARTS